MGSSALYFMRNPNTLAKPHHCADFQTGLIYLQLYVELDYIKPRDFIIHIALMSKNRTLDQPRALTTINPVAYYLVLVPY